MPAIFPVLAYYAGTIGTTALLAGGATAAGMSMSANAKADTEAKNAANDQAGAVRGMIDTLNQPITAPTPANAGEAARLAAEKQRRIRALAGGQTLLATGTPALSSGGGKTLLGA